VARFFLPLPVPAGRASAGFAPSFSFFFGVFGGRLFVLFFSLCVLASCGAFFGGSVFGLAGCSVFFCSILLQPSVFCRFLLLFFYLTFALFYVIIKALAGGYKIK